MNGGFLSQSTDGEIRSVLDEVFHCVTVFAQTGPMQWRSPKKVLVIHVESGFNESFYDFFD